MSNAPLRPREVKVADENNGGFPAYPGQPRGQDGSPCASYEPGLTKRELFAAMAMQGLLADPDINSPNDLLARCAVGYADALLKELAK
jgi:hypothetical protein